MIKFRNDLQQADWTPVYDGVDINHSYDTFLNILTNAFERCFTLTKLSRKRMKDKPWVTTALKKSSHLKNLLYKKWIKTRSPMHEYKYKTYRKIYKKVAHEAEITYYKELFDLRKNSTKELWANLNKVCSF